MSAQLLDGSSLASKVESELSLEVQKLASIGKSAGLGTLLVGDDAASDGYVRRKHEACARVGIKSFDKRLPKDATEADVLAVVEELNNNPKVSAFLVQLPLPSHLDSDKILQSVMPAKDADGLHPYNLGKLMMGSPGPIPCTPAGIQRLLVNYSIPIEGKHVVIVGRGLTIGRPLAVLLSQKAPHANAAVTAVHTGVPDVGSYTRQADIVIAAAGVPGIIKPDMIKPGAVVVGAGISWSGKRILSDVEDSVAQVASWITPRIGGVGPMTVSMLMANAIKAAQISE